MQDEKFSMLAQDLDALSEDHAGHISQDAAPVLATPAAALAFTAGATLVGGAYALGQAVG